MLVIEHAVKAYRITAVEGVGLRAAWWVGVAQCCSLVPGVSRSAATIMGGLQHTFKPIAYYRIVLGIGVLAVLG